MKYSIQSLVNQLGQVEPDPGEVRPEPENPEEPGPGDESELIDDDTEFDVADEIDDDFWRLGLLIGRVFNSKLDIMPAVNILSVKPQ